MTSMPTEGSAYGAGRLTSARRSWSRRGPLGAVSPAMRDLAMAVVFAGVLVVQLAHHQMWRDELNAWGLVLASPHLSDLFTNLHYEGHPGLWHLLLWVASKVSTAPQTLQVVHGAIGFALIGLVCFASPFERYEKLLILLGYFVLFEYTVVSRNYGIALLLALGYAARRSCAPEQRLRNAALLGLLANTNIFALILSGGFALEYGWTLLSDGRHPRTVRFRALLAPATIFGGLLVLSIATLWPAADISWRTTGRPLAAGVSLDRVVEVVVNNVSGLVPLTARTFWAPPQDIGVTGYVVARLVLTAMIPLLVAVYLRLFGSRRPLLLIPGVTLLGSTLFGVIFYEGSIRHWGITFVAFLATLWIMRAGKAGPSIWSTAIFAINAVVGVAFVVGYWTTPFSNAGAAAAWLTDHGYADATIAGTPDTHLAAVAELMGRPAYYVDCRCSDTYLVYSRRRDDFARHDIPARLAELAQTDASKPLVYLDGPGLTDTQRADLVERGWVTSELASIGGANTENFHIYAVTRAEEGAR